MINYEFTAVRDSKRVKEQIGDLSLKGIIKIQSSFKLGFDWDIIIKMDPEKLEQVTAALKPFKVKYRSPTYFCYSSIRPVYNSVEDELKKNESEEYLKHLLGECPGKCKPNN